MGLHSSAGRPLQCDAEATGSNPVEASKIFFFFSGYLAIALKLLFNCDALSHLHFICISAVHNSFHSVLLPKTTLYCNENASNHLLLRMAMISIFQAVSRKHRQKILWFALPAKIHVISSSQFCTRIFCTSKVTKQSY